MVGLRLRFSPDIRSFERTTVEPDVRHTAGVRFDLARRTILTGTWDEGRTGKEFQRIEGTKAGRGENRKLWNMEREAPFFFR